MEHRQVKEIMECDLELVSANASLQDAASKMRENECGFLPVGENDYPEGIITDRDIVIRAIAEGKNPTEEKVRDYMTACVCSCRDDDTINEAAKIMSDNDVSRLLVKDNDDKVCGVITFGRIIRSSNEKDDVNNVVKIATGKIE